LRRLKNHDKIFFLKFLSQLTTWFFLQNYIITYRVKYLFIMNTFPIIATQYDQFDDLIMTQNPIVTFLFLILGEMY